MSDDPRARVAATARDARTARGGGGRLRGSRLRPGHPRPARSSACCARCSASALSPRSATTRRLALRHRAHEPTWSGSSTTSSERPSGSTRSARELTETRDGAAHRRRPRRPPRCARRRARLEALGILAGTLAGQRTRRRAPDRRPGRRSPRRMLLDTVQELRDAGAEAIQIGDVRVVASTSFVDGPDGTVVADGVDLGRRTRSARWATRDTIGAALAIPGGVVETLAGGGAATVDAPRRGRRSTPCGSSDASVRSAGPDAVSGRHRHDRTSVSDFEYPDDLQYTAEHEWVRVDERRRRRGRHHRLRPGRARRHRLRGPARRWAPWSPPAARAARSSRPRASARSTRRSPARSWPRNEALDRRARDGQLRPVRRRVAGRDPAADAAARPTDCSTPRPTGRCSSSLTAVGPLGRLTGPWRPA